MQFKFFSAAEIQNFINENSLFVNKKYGQNFLINSGAADSIVKSADITPKSLVFEIGSGLGGLTSKILNEKCALYAFEIDRAYAAHLRSLFGGFENFNLIEGDFLKTIQKTVRDIDLTIYDKVVFIGNLPYYITTPIIEKIFFLKINYDSLIFMVQKEVAERFTAHPGTKKYGSISIFCQYFTEPEIVARITPASFYPKPKVDSAVVKFVKKKASYSPLDESLFFRVARSLFINRRKQIKNNLLLSPFLRTFEKERIAEALKNAGIAESLRGEVLDIERIIKFADEIKKLV
jgi:16S rRNA (adenine1518-N6/adenine1519-N6)-dimethyltransferase